MLKIVGVGSWGSMDVAPVQVVKVARAGLGTHDRQQLLVKRAMAKEFAERLANHPLRPGDIPVHIVALGATEFYGPNRNGDGFKEAWCRQHHDGFVKYAKYYRNHRNKDASKRYGHVVASAYNEPMRRVELLAIANGTEKAAERNGGLVLPAASVEALLAEKPVEYSMACSISHDECANCGKQARSRAEYCDELECVNPHTGYRGFGCRSGLTKTANDGYQQYVDNPNPKWFDISEVPVHADRIAFGGLATYLKEAGALSAVGGAELAEQLLSPDYGDTAQRQLHTLPKLAAYEQALRSRPLTAQESGLLQGLGQLRGQKLASAVKFGGVGFTAALSALQQSRTLLSPRDFFAWAADGDAEKIAGIDEALLAVPHAFNSLLFTADMDTALLRNPYVVDNAARVKLAQLPHTPLTAESVKRAAQRSVLSAPTAFNPGSTQVSAAADGLARQYALYKLAMLSACVDDEDFSTLCQLAVLQNFAA